MNIVGCIIFFIAGIIAVKLTKWAFAREPKDYSLCDTAVGEVCGTEDFCGERWIVSFLDKNGNEVLGMDDYIVIYTSFWDRHDYKSPIRRSEEQIYYYPCTENSRYIIGNKEVKYYIHFRNEEYYELAKHKRQIYPRYGAVVGGLFMIAGLLILVSGYR